MADRELLELAAKAAGIKIEWGEVFNIGDCEVDCTDLAFADDSSPDDAAPSVWNPLTDDGDALRLAVRLNLQVTPGTYWPNAVSVFRAAYAEAIERDCTDMYAATRRAIVRAAAEIGRNMP